MTNSSDAFDRVTRRRAVVPVRDNSYLPVAESTMAPSTEKENSTEVHIPDSKAKRSQPSQRQSLEVSNPEKEELITVTIRVTKALNEQTKRYFQPSFKRGNFSTFVQAAFELLSQDDANLNIEKMRNQVLEKSARIAEKRTQEGKRKRVMTMYDNEMKGT